MSKIQFQLAFFVIFLTNFLGINAGSTCSSRGRRYNELYWEADLTMRNTNNICNAIQNHTMVTDYYCNDYILKVGLENWPYPNTAQCISGNQVSRMREMRINYEYLNVYICNEIRSNSSVIIPPEIPNEYCMTFGSNSYIKPSLIPILLMILGQSNFFW